MKTLRKSVQKDPEVTVLQNKLNLARAKVHGNWPALNPDGVFGTATENAVKAFQVYSNISRDGIVGSKTWEKLEETCTNRHLIEPALCDFDFNTDSKLFMCRITNDPEREEIDIKELATTQSGIIDDNKKDSLPLVSSVLIGAMPIADYAIGILGAKVSLVDSNYLKYNRIWHIKRTGGVAFSFQSNWKNPGAVYWRLQQTKPLEGARAFSRTLTKAGFVMVGADILLSGEIKPSHGINSFMLGLSMTGWGAIIAAGWLAVDIGVGGYNFFVHGEFETLSDKIDKNSGSIKLDKVLTQYGEYQKREAENGFWGLSKI